MDIPVPARVGLIGFGEVGSIFARDLRALGVKHIAAFDIASGPDSLARRRAAADHAKRGHLELVASAAEAVAKAPLVISCVTAGSALAASRSVVGHLLPGAFFLDVNSISPGAKLEDAAVITEAGGRYVEAAVMTSVPPHGLRSPMLLGGPHAEAFIDFAAGLDMRLTFQDIRIGVASSVKMCRSVMIKGLEALTTECMLTARHYGVEQQVLASLSDTLPHPDWEGLARYVMSRALIHGRRRAEEMREVARTVAEAGIEPLLAAPTAVRQDWAADQGSDLPRELLRDGAPLAPLLDAILARLPKAGNLAAD
jgi:3-hydroxyisobutyrate dehydrogenase-like beta-hydroxyacid dehydrogenase